MKNDNCLNGIECPMCGSEEAFLIEIRTMAEVTDEGVGDLEGDNEWDDRSYIQCKCCDHGGVVRGFTVTRMKFRAYKCLVPCVSLTRGEPDLWAVKILCTKVQWEANKHFKAACDAARKEGHEVANDEIVFDIFFDGWSALEATVEWDTVDVVDIRSKRKCLKKK